MLRTLLLSSLTACGCCCFEPYDRDGPDAKLPPLPREDKPGARFDQEVNNLLGPDRTFDPDIRPPFTYFPEPRLPVAPKAEDPPWRNR